MDELWVELRGHAGALLRHRWIALGVAWLVAIGGWIAVGAMPDRYQADARVYIDADAVLTPLLRGLALDNSLSSQIEVLQQTLLSRPNLEKLISKTDLSLAIASPSDEERMIGRLAHQIEVVPQTRDLFTITYRNRDPRLAYDVVRTVLGIFAEDKAGTSRADMANANAFLVDQIATYERQLRDAEARRAAFRAKYIDLLPAEGVGGGGASRLDEASADLRHLTGELADAQARHRLLAGELAGTAPVTGIAAAPSSGSGGGELAAAEAKLHELEATLTDAHPDVIRQKEVVASLRRSGGGSPHAGGTVHGEPSIVYQQLEVMQVQCEADIASLTRRVADARADVARLEQIARDVPNVQAQSVNLNRDYDVLRKNYEELLARREAMRLADAADTRADKIKLEVVDPPQLPRIPVAPNRPLLLSVVLIGAVGAGIGVALVLGKLDRSFRDLAQLRALGLPVAGSVSMIVDRTARRAGAIAGHLALTAAAALLVVAWGGLVWRALAAPGIA